MKKNVAVLGVGEHQLSGIKQLKKKFFIYGFDNNEKAHSRKFIDKFFNIDINEKEKILKICRKNNIKKIISFNSEATMFTTLWINDKLEKKNSINKFRVLNKIKLREHLKKNGFPVPKFSYLKSINLVKKTYFPAVVKPSSGSGSKGVFYSKNYNQFRNLFNQNKYFYNKKNILIEKYIPGIEYAVEGWVTKNKIFTIGAISKKKRSKLPLMFDESLIINYQSSFIKKIIYKFMEKFIKSLKLSNVPVHMEFKIYKKKLYLIDFSLRGAGFSVYSEIISEIIDQNTDQIIIDMFFNKNIELKKPNENKYYLKFFYKKDLLKIERSKKKFKNLSSFRKITYYNYLNTFNSNKLTRYGHVLLCSQNISILKRDLKKIEIALV